MHQSELIEILRKHGFRFSHKLGQNFIFDKSLLARIADAAGLCAGGAVLEVGPGAGTLTRELAKRVGDEGKVIAVEIDAALLPVLGEVLADLPVVKIVHGDILKVDIGKLIGDAGGGRFDVVANLPYYITTPVIMRFLEEGYPLGSLTIMIQREVADRICAKPGTKAYGALSIAVQYRCNVTKALDVPAGAFTPKPKVDSRVLRLVIRDTPVVALNDEKHFFSLVRAAFHMRRKTLANNLCASFSLSRGHVAALLESTGISNTARGETLGLEDFARLSDAMLSDEKCKLEI